jgi:hypothetical protein
LCRTSVPRTAATPTQGGTSTRLQTAFSKGIISLVILVKPLTFGLFSLESTTNYTFGADESASGRIHNT